VDFQKFLDSVTTKLKFSFRCSIFSYTLYQKNIQCATELPAFNFLYRYRYQSKSFRYFRWQGTTSLIFLSVDYQIIFLIQH